MNLKEMCKSLRLAYVAEIYKSIPIESSEVFLMTLFETEMRLREEAKAEQLIKKVKFIKHKSLEDYRWHDNIYFPRNLKKEELMSLSFIDYEQRLSTKRVTHRSPWHREGTSCDWSRTGRACRKGKEERR